MRILEEKQPLQLAAGTHMAYCPAGVAALDRLGARYELAQGHALRIEFVDKVTIGGVSGRMLVASIG